MRILKTVMVEGDGIALDALLFEVTGREDLVPATLDANFGLAALGPILPAGTLVRIPDLPAPEDLPRQSSVTLWSE